jgi:predicted  nucleic acid-binding Zn-ribbon protein
MSNKPEDGEERDQLMLLIKAQAEALRDFIAKTERHLKKVDARLDKHWEAIRELNSDTSDLDDKISDLDDTISDLDERKQDAPEERELRNAAEQEELERLEKEDADKNAELKYLDLHDRLESLEQSLDLDGESLAESLKELADNLEELEKFVRRRLK